MTHQQVRVNSENKCDTKPLQQSGNWEEQTISGWRPFSERQMADAPHQQQGRKIRDCGPLDICTLSDSCDRDCCKRDESSEQQKSQFNYSLVVHLSYRSQLRLAEFGDLL